MTWTYLNSRYNMSYLNSLNDKERIFNAFRFKRVFKANAEEARHTHINRKETELILHNVWAKLNTQTLF